MRVVITEDIISRALNESIDEFILEEGMDEGKFGNAVKGVWNGLKNAAALYMDWRTQGQWNNKYGIHANGKGKITEMFYLGKWFGYHLNEISAIERRLNDPTYFSKNEIQWGEDEYGKRTGTQTINKYNNIQNYASQMVTSTNFNAWVGRFIQDREALKYIDDYIDNYARKVTNYREALKILNVTNFIKTYPDYINKKRKDLPVSNPKNKSNNNSKSGMTNIPTF